MNTSVINDPLREQIFSLPNLIEEQLKQCFGSKLQELMTYSEIFDVRKIIITGCGDSYAAAIAMAPVIEKYCDCFGVTVMRTIEFTRFASKQSIGIGEPNSPLVIVISAGGGTSRIREALQKANEIGAFSLLLTNKKDSPSAQLARSVFYLETPPFPNDSPGLRSYFASLLGLCAIAVRIGIVRGVLPPTAAQECQSAISNIGKTMETSLPKIENQMLELAQKWSAFTKFDFIGDGTDHASALFAADKFAECNGNFFTSTDTEDWCHINYFLKAPETIGTVFVVDKNSPSFSRAVETIASAHIIGRPVLVVTNADKANFINGISVCTMPPTPPNYPWLAPLFAFVPGALLAGFIAKLQGENYFRGSFVQGSNSNANNPFFNSETLTLSTSAIEIFT